LSAILGCTKTNTSDCNSASISYSTTVSPLILSTCSYNSSCHGAGSQKGPGALLTYAQVVANKVRVRSTVSDGSMPQGSTLTATQKNTIICWVDAGAANN
jgi:hypothetical protein